MMIDWTNILIYGAIFVVTAFIWWQIVKWLLP